MWKKCEHVKCGFETFWFETRIIAFGQMWMCENMLLIQNAPNPHSTCVSCVFHILRDFNMRLHIYQCSAIITHEINIIICLNFDIRASLNMKLAHEIPFSLVTSL